MDSRGVMRGKCTSCACAGFVPQKGVSKCSICYHLPGKHARIGAKDGAKPVTQGLSNLTLSDNKASIYPKCSVEDCDDEVHVDLHSGKQSMFCEQHNSLQRKASDSDSSSESDGADTDTCAIKDCDRPRYVDPSGKVHECCGYTHAMELTRRKILKGKTIAY